MYKNHLSISSSEENIYSHMRYEQTAIQATIFSFSESCEVVLKMLPNIVLIFWQTERYIRKFLVFWLLLFSD